MSYWEADISVLIFEQNIEVQPIAQTLSYYQLETSISNMTNDVSNWFRYFSNDQKSKRYKNFLKQ